MEQRERENEALLSALLGGEEQVETARAKLDEKTERKLAESG